MPRPPQTLHLKYKKQDIVQPDFYFPLEDVLDDSTLYDHFLRYLVRVVCSENLRFLRAVRVFKERLASPQSARRAEASDWAWTIFRFFLNPNASYEISIEHNERRNIMRQLAVPTVDMFADVERRTAQLLKLHYDTYRRQAGEYAMLKSKAIEAIARGSTDTGGGPQQASAASTKPSSSKNFSCFG